MAKVSIVKTLQRRKFLRIGSVIALIGIFAALIGTDVWQRINPTKAANRNISNTIYLGVGQNRIGSTTYGTNDNITVKSGGTLILDGAHSFNNLTVEDGGMITTTDYNRYGINVGNIEGANYDCPCSELLNCSREATILAGRDYRNIFTVGGFINFTGPLVANNSVKIAIGHPREPSENNYTMSTFRPDDYGAFVYYDSISRADADNFNFNANAPAGSLYAEYGGAESGFINNTTSLDKPVIPFQFTIINTGGPSRWSIGWSQTAPSDSLGNAANYYLFNLLDSTIPFSTSTSGTAQIKTMYAVQANLSDYYSSLWLDQGGLEQITSNMYNLKSNYYSVDNYNMYTDTYVRRLSYGSTASLTDFDNPGILDSDQNPHNNIYSGSKYFSFYSTDVADSPEAYHNTPLAGKPVGGSSNLFPYLSEQLYNVIKTNYSFASKRLIISVARDFVLETGGQVNVNGKGFAPGHGFSPGWLTTGASHAGLGANSVASAYYDNTENTEPIAPGSGGYRGTYATTVAQEYYQYYGGGYINVISGKSITNNNSFVTADAIGFSLYSDSYWGASSGGSVILKDASLDSNYLGVISAWGAGSDRRGGSSINRRGGGGGHIYVNTRANLYNAANLLGASWNSKNIPAGLDIGNVGNRYGYASRIAGGDYDKFLNNIGDLHFHDATSFRSGSITALGGIAENEADSDYWGQWGLVSIIIAQDSGSLGQPFKKTLHTVSVPGFQTPLNPYSLSLGDTIEVKLEFDDPPASGTEIKDELLETNNSTPTPNYICQCNFIDITPLGDCTQGSDVTWIANGSTTEYKYNCTVQ